MTTFTMQDLNQMPVTKEEEEAMDALSRLGAGVPLDRARELLHEITERPPTIQAETPDVGTIINTICAQLQLLTSVISKNQGNSHGGEAGEKSLQECVDTTLQQAEWFKEVVEERVGTAVEEYIDGKDFAYEINSEVEDWFSNSFSLDDHVDIEAEVESKVEEILDRMVDERLAELVEEKLQNATINVSF